jgi:hypothetical protein
MAVTTVVGVPGHWKDQSEIVRAIASPPQNPEYLFAGLVILELATNANMILEVREHDPNLAKAFRCAGTYSNFTQADLDAISKHTYCLYLVDMNGGNKETAFKIMRFATKLLRAGGLAVKVESAGKSHTASDWLALSERATSPSSLLESIALFEAFVVLVGDQHTGFYSCGMHNLGLPDARLLPGLSNKDAGALLHGFLRYVLLEQPTLHSNQTFSLSEDAPRYRLMHRSCHEFNEDALFHNPFGVWELNSV